MTKTKVLLVDDEVEFAKALSERLRMRKYDAKALYKSEDVIATVQKDAPDVVLLDLRMPGMDGLEILKKIKQAEPSIEVIMLTGLGDLKSMEEGMNSGAFDYIVKPVDIEELIVKIEKAKKRAYK